MSHSHEARRESKKQPKVSQKARREAKRDRQSNTTLLGEHGQQQ